MTLITVGSDHVVPVPTLGVTFSITVVDGGTVYYQDHRTVSSTTNQGSLTSGQSATFSEQVWLIASSVSNLDLEYIAATVALPVTAVIVDSGTAPQLNAATVEVDQNVLYYDSGSGKIKGKVVSGGGGGAGTLLGRTFYAPSTPVTYPITASVLTAVDATHLSIAFTTAASGPGSTEVLAKAQFGTQIAQNLAVGFLGTGAPSASYEVGASDSSITLMGIVEILVTGLTAATTYTWELGAHTNTGTQNIFAGSNASGIGNNAIPALLTVHAGLS